MMKKKLNLTIELVPSTCWYSNVRTNVPKETWDIIRKKVYKNAKHKCEICGGKGKKWPVECHEIWNYDDEQHIQKLEGMIALCPDCHKVKHIGYASVKGEFDASVDHISKVNNWDRIRSINYIDEQFKIWSKRSQHDWILDIKILDKYL